MWRTHGPSEEVSTVLLWKMSEGVDGVSDGSRLYGVSKLGFRFSEETGDEPG